MNYKKVSKPVARKMYKNGCSIKLLPCKIPDSAVDGSHPWVKPIDISLILSKEIRNHFDREVNFFEVYNCNAEVGYYAHYFVTEEEYNNYQMCKIMC